MRCPAATIAGRSCTTTRSSPTARCNTSASRCSWCWRARATRHGARGNPKAAIAKAPRQLKGSLSIGGQEQFYLEGQIAYAIPLEDGGMLVHCSTQHPTEMQNVVAHALGIDAHRVRVECRRMGG